MALGLLLASCGGDDADCELETALAAAEPAGVTDCGTLALSDDDTDFEAARSCIADAIDAERPFRAVWQRQGIDSEVHEAYLGTWDGDQLRVIRYGYDGDPSGGSGAHATSYGYECNAFTDTDPCTTLREDLCYACTSGAQVHDCE